MKVFVTGASGFIGSAVVQELLSAGHEVIGLARSDESAQAIIDAGAQVLKGSLDNLDSFKARCVAGGRYNTHRFYSRLQSVRQSSGYR